MRMLGRTRRRAVAALALLALLGFAIAGCVGTQEKPAASSASLPAETAPPPQAPPPEQPTAPPPALTVDVTGSYIGPGSKSDAVEKVQRALAELGYKPGKPDGIYGAKTQKAVKAFQRKQGLEADGLVGPKTADAINQALAK